MKKYSILILRILMGLPLAFFGIMGLFKIMPDPHAFWESQEDFAPQATSFLLAMWDSRFMMLSVVFAHLIAGLLLLVNRYVPFALAMHLPVSLLMFLFHLVLDPATGGIAYLIFLLNVYLIYRYRNSYQGLLEQKTPTPN